MICTHVAHKRHIKRKNRFLCLLWAHHHVPGVCTYLGVRTTLKFGIRRFQRRVPIVYTTKTRLCGSFQSFHAKVLVLMQQPVSGTSLMMLKLINSHLELKNGVSNVIVEDLGGLGGRNVAIFNKFSKMMLNVSACQFMDPQPFCGGKIRLKNKI